MQERLRYEAESLREMHRHCPQHVVEVFDYDPDMHVISMQYLRPPHVVLRYGLLDGAVYPRLAAQVAEQLACCLFRTSQLALPPDVFRAAADRFSNSEMCRLTEQVRCPTLVVVRVHFRRKKRKRWRSVALCR